MSGKDVGAGRSWYRRRASVFSFAVAALGIALIALAWWEANRERLAWERQRGRDLEKAADRVAERILANLSDYTSELSRHPLEGPLDPPGPKLASRLFPVELFVISNAGQVKFPRFRPPYRLDRPGPKLPVGLDAKPEKLREGESFEFARKDPSGAVPAYRAALSSAATAAQRARAMNALARVLAKAGRSSEALAAYQSLIRDFSTELSEEGLPFGLVGLFASAQIETSVGKFEEAGRTLLNLREGLLRGVFDLDKAQFASFLELAEDRFASLAERLSPGNASPALAARNDSLMKEEEDIIERARRAEIISLDPTPYRADQTTFSILPDSSRRYLVGALPLPEGGTFGAVFDAEQVARRLIPEAVASLGAAGGIHADLIAGYLPKGPEAMRAGTSAKPGASFERPLAPHLPQWIVRTWFSPGWEFPRFGVRRTIYVGAALFLTGIVLAGGLVTIRSMAREMEVLRLKTDFVATVSHELRTPLTSIRYISELLKNGRGGEDDRRARYYATLSNESERLGRIIENILDFSKIEAGLKEYRFERTEIAAWTMRVADRFREIVAPKGYVLKTDVVEPLPALALDQEALERALFNLLDNAVKFSGASKEVRVRVSAASGRVRWEVIDHGLGIAEEDKDRVFERFFRSRSGADPGIKGSGIGLTIAKHIVEAHGGTVEVESEVGKGSTFIVEIPTRTGPQENVR